jgi:C4-dicarboxylate-binding protein DctP
VRKSGKTEVITLTAAQKAEWKKALLPVHREMEGRIGKDMIQEVYKETGFKP